MLKELTHLGVPKLLGGAVASFSSVLLPAIFAAFPVINVA